MEEMTCCFHGSFICSILNVPMTRQTGLQSRVTAKSHKEPYSGETGKLCTESCSGVSILVTSQISALIGQSVASKTIDNIAIMWMLACLYEEHWIAINGMFVVEYFSQYQGNCKCWKWIPCIVYRSTCVTEVLA